MNECQPLSCGIYRQNLELTGRLIGSGSMGRGVIENRHSTDVESPPHPAPPPLRVCMGIQLKVKSRSNIGRVRGLNDPSSCSSARLYEHSI